MPSSPGASDPLGDTATSLPPASSIIDLERPPPAEVQPSKLARALRIRIGAALLIQRWWRHRKRWLDREARRKARAAARAKHGGHTSRTVNPIAKPTHCSDNLGQGYVADFFPILEEWCAVGMGREGAPALDDLRVAQSIVYKNGVIAYWLFRDAKSGTIRLRKRNEAILPNIMAEFGRPVPGTDIVAYYVGLATDPKRGEEPVTVEFFDEKRLKLFLSGPKREDGLLQRYFPGLGDSETTYRVTWSAGLFKVEQRTNLSKCSDLNIHRYRRSVTFDGPPHFSRHTELQHRHRVYKRIHSLTRRLVAAIEITKLDWKPRYLVLNWKFDQQDRVYLLWCSTLRMINADSLLSFCWQCGRQVTGDAAMYNHSIAARNLPYKKVTNADLKPPAPRSGHSPPPPAAHSRSRAASRRGSAEEPPSDRASSPSQSFSSLSTSLSPSRPASRPASRPPSRPPSRPTSAHGTAQPTIAPPQEPLAPPSPPFAPPSPVAEQMEMSRRLSGLELYGDEEGELYSFAVKEGGEEAPPQPAVLEFSDVFGGAGLDEGFPPPESPPPGRPPGPGPSTWAEPDGLPPPLEVEESGYELEDGTPYEPEREDLIKEDDGQGEWPGDAVQGHDAGSPGARASRPASAAPWRARSAVRPASVSPPAPPTRAPPPVRPAYPYSPPGRKPAPFHVGGGPLFTDAWAAPPKRPPAPDPRPATAPLASSSSAPALGLGLSRATPSTRSLVARLYERIHAASRRQPARQRPRTASPPRVIGSSRAPLPPYVAADPFPQVPWPPVWGPPPDPPMYEALGRPPLGWPVEYLLAGSRAGW